MWAQHDPSWWIVMTAWMVAVWSVLIVLVAWLVARIASERSDDPGADGRPESDLMDSLRHMGRT